MLKTITFALACPLLALSGASMETGVADEVELIEELTNKTDEADPALFEQLAEFKTRAAAEGLIEAHEKTTGEVSSHCVMNSTFSNELNTIPTLC